MARVLPTAAAPAAKPSLPHTPFLCSCHSCHSCCLQVTIVGKVLSTQESGLTYGLTIDDGTGRAATKIWISEDGE